MSYDQTFRGRFVFADERCLEAGLDQFAAHARDSIVGLDDLQVHGLTVIVDMDCSAPASMYEDTTLALRMLGEHAKSGSIKATFTMDSTDRETLRAGRRTRSAGLPEPHHSWAVFYAAKAGDAERLRALAEAGIPLAREFASYGGQSTLHLAAASGSGDAITALLDAGCDPELGAASYGAPPLALAATVEAARALLAAGAEIGAAPGNALLAALDHRRFAVAELLLDHGARLASADWGTAARECVYGAELALLQRLLRAEPGLAPLLAEPELMTAAIRTGHPPVVDFLLAHGAALPDDLLTRAIDSGSLAMTELALAQPGARERCGPSSGYGDAMCVAARDGNLAILDRLAALGVPLHPSEPGQTSPLHCAARGRGDGAVDCVTWLLDHGAPIDALDADGHTPLRVAVESYVPATAARLLERGADPTGVTKANAPGRAYLRKALGARYAELVPAKRPRKRTAAPSP